MALRNPSEQLSLIRKANSMKKLSRQPLSKCERPGTAKRIQARLLREHRALSEKDHAAQVSAEKWVQRVRKQLQSRIAASWEIEMRRVNINVRLALVERWLVKGSAGK